jgi:hypothetical protein
MADFVIRVYRRWDPDRCFYSFFYTFEHMVLKYTAHGGGFDDIESLASRLYGIIDTSVDARLCSTLAISKVPPANKADDFDEADYDDVLRLQEILADIHPAWHTACSGLSD